MLFILLLWTAINGLVVLCFTKSSLNAVFFKLYQARFALWGGFSLITVAKKHPNLERMLFYLLENFVPRNKNFFTCVSAAAKL